MQNHPSAGSTVLAPTKKAKASVAEVISTSPREEMAIRCYRHGDATGATGHGNPLHVVLGIRMPAELAGEHKGVVHAEP